MTTCWASNSSEVLRLWRESQFRTGSQLSSMRPIYLNICTLPIRMFKFRVARSILQYIRVYMVWATTTPTRHHSRFTEMHFNSLLSNINGLFSLISHNVVWLQWSPGDVGHSSDMPMWVTISGRRSRFLRGWWIKAASASILWPLAGVKSRRS